jgi:hypothetical protein
MREYTHGIYVLSIKYYMLYDILSTICSDY